MGLGVIIRKRTHGGVIASRFCASEKNANTSPRGRGSQSSEIKWRIFTPLGLPAYAKATAWHADLRLPHRSLGEGGTSAYRFSGTATIAVPFSSPASFRVPSA